jgi:HPt (histidine-containing phosphotransfer) domain-containing protein
MSHNTDDEHKKSDPNDEDEFALTDLLPQYFALCRRDLEHLQRALQDGIFDDIRIVGHNLKGSGGAYGFPELSEMGLSIETAAKAQHRQVLQKQIQRFADFLNAHESSG